MQAAKLLTLFTFIALFGVMGVASQAESMFEHWRSGPWQYQGMVSFGDDKLVVDFGENGLWNFNGSWLRLSHWNPESMVSWGEQNLAVDFGTHGLWNYDGVSWNRIGSGSL
jgi:hypothetical protein